MNKDEQEVYFCAFRYALGRRSYIVGSIANILIKRIKDFSDKYIEMFKKEIEEFFDEPEEYHSSIDVHWMSLLREVDKEIISRGIDVGRPY